FIHELDKPHQADIIERVKFRPDSVHQVGLAEFFNFIFHRVHRSADFCGNRIDIHELIVVLSKIADDLFSQFQIIIRVDVFPVVLEVGLPEAADLAVFDFILDETVDGALIRETFLFASQPCQTAQIVRMPAGLGAGVHGKLRGDRLIRRVYFHYIAQERRSIRDGQRFELYKVETPAQRSAHHGAENHGHRGAGYEHRRIAALGLPIIGSCNVYPSSFRRQESL
ncbi:MAG: hypothetical protein GY841_20865, partial [FCB group bacterium]|nr:hypothetical protein [FCB group bacterium]